MRKSRGVPKISSKYKKPVAFNGHQFNLYILYQLRDSEILVKFQNVVNKGSENSNMSLIFGVQMCCLHFSFLCYILL